MSIRNKKSCLPSLTNRRSQVQAFRLFFVIRKIISAIIVRKTDIELKHCRKWIADGTPSRNSANSAEAHVALVSIHNEVLVAEPDTEDWFIDNGVHKYVTSRSDLFRLFKKFSNTCSIKAAGNERLAALGSGIIEVSSVVNGRKQQILPNGVPYGMCHRFHKTCSRHLAAHDRNMNSEFVDGNYLLMFS